MIHVDDQTRTMPGPAHTPTTGAGVAALMATLGIGDPDVVGPLFAHGMRAHTVPVLDWLPAVDVCWLDGADVAERHALRVQFAAEAQSTPGGLILLDRWLTEKPPTRFFEAGSRALRARLSSMDPDARDEALGRIVAIAEAAGRAGGGGFGAGPLSHVERERIAQIRRDLESSH